ncbi:hypothetical protein JCM5296_006785 [Sporobolomyces johnsonii]
MASLAHRLFRATSWDQPILSPSKVQAAYLSKLEQECPLLEPAQRELLTKLEMTKLPPWLFRSPRFRVLDALLKATSATLVIIVVADGLLTIKDISHRVRKLEREGTAAELEATKKIVGGLGAVGVPVPPLA